MPLEQRTDKHLETGSGSTDHDPLALQFGNAVDAVDGTVKAEGEREPDG